MLIQPQAEGLSLVPHQKTKGGVVLLRTIAVFLGLPGKFALRLCFSERQHKLTPLSRRPLGASFDTARQQDCETRRNFPNSLQGRPARKQTFTVRATPWQVGIQS